MHHNVGGVSKCGKRGPKTVYADEVTCEQCKILPGQARRTSITLRRALRLCLHESGGDLCTRRAGHQTLHSDLEVGIEWARTPDDDCAPQES